MIFSQFQGGAAMKRLIALILDTDQLMDTPRR